LSSSVKVLRHQIIMRLAWLVVVSLLLVAAAQSEGAARAVKDDEISLGSFFSSIYGFFQSGFSSMFGSAKESKSAKPVSVKKVNYRRFGNTFVYFFSLLFHAYVAVNNFLPSKDRSDRLKFSSCNNVYRVFCTFILFATK
jgi:hypothetical protein